MKTTFSLILVLLTGCSAYRYTSPSSGEEMIMASLVMQRCDELGESVKVVWTEEPYMIDGTLYGFDGPVKAAAWALSRSKRVAVYTGSLDHEWPHAVLDNLARHECCHVKLGHTLSTPEIEAAADQCVVENWND